MLATGGAMAFEWTGVYVGAHGGYGFGTDDVTTTLRDSSGAPMAPTGHDSFNVDGYLAGVTAGANYQIDQFVLGVEGRYSAGDVSGEFNYNIARPEAIAGGTLNGLASLSARAGVAFDSTLIYARGGYAVGWNEGFSNNVMLPAPAVDVATGTGTVQGYVIGAGVEHAVTEQISVGLDYSYYGFQRGELDMTSSAYPAGAVLHTDPQLSLGVVTAGVNFHF